MLRACLALLLMILCAPLWAAELRTLNWQELIPEGAPPQVPQMTPMHDMSQLGDALSEGGAASLQQFPAAPVVKEMDGQNVKIPGYIVPLDVTEEGRVTEFLLVPYFGACIHVPPPPSNQIIHVNAELGVLLDALYQPFWVEGPLKVEHSSSELAEVGYQMAAEKIYAYELPAN